MARRPAQGEIPNALANFDRLPDSAFVDKHVVKALYGGISDMTLDRWSRSGTIPAPVKLSERRNGWNVGALRRDMAECRPAYPAPQNLAACEPIEVVASAPRAPIRRQKRTVRAHEPASKPSGQGGRPSKTPAPARTAQRVPKSSTPRRQADEPLAEPPRPTKSETPVTRRRRAPATVPAR